MTRLHRLVSVLGSEIYSGGQRTDGCAVDMREGGREEKREGVLGELGEATDL